MSAPGHCRHCHHLCPGGDEEYVGNGAYVREHCSVDDEAQWSDGHCPACDEAERIAQLLDEEAATAGPERLPDHDARAQTWQAAANLARGRR